MTSGARPNAEITTSLMPKPATSPTINRMDFFLMATSKGISRLLLIRSTRRLRGSWPKFFLQSVRTPKDRHPLNSHFSFQKPYRKTCKFRKTEIYRSCLFDRSSPGFSGTDVSICPTDVLPLPGACGGGPIRPPFPPYFKAGSHRVPCNSADSAPTFCGGVFAANLKHSE